MEILLSKSTIPIIGWIAQLLGWIMNGIYIILNAIGILNIGLAIIFYTIIVHMLMIPFQVKQQKISKIMSVIHPEMQKVEKKYQGTKDQASQMKMQKEIMEIYQKYGVSPMESCLPLLIQLPLLFALYQVIYHIPGYVTKVGAIFDGLAVKLSQPNILDSLTQFAKDNKIAVQFCGTGETLQKRITDFLYLLKPDQWKKLAEVNAFSNLKSAIENTAAQSKQVNMFAGINISESPWDVIKNGIEEGAWMLVIIAILVPLLAWLTQWLNYKLMSQQTIANSQQNSMQDSVKIMNTIMPIFSAFMCITFSIGIGIYWIVGAVIRCIQQVIINRNIAKINLEELMKKKQTQ
ncbi:MAG: membrane protein insertase YidC [Lachnospiraceae bacterium]|nr:membrane protein insertase YidC [Lachnospiraceae bacterium]